MAEFTNLVAVRDTKNRNGGDLIFTRSAFDRLLGALKATPRDMA